jgi:hypothetical protein
MDDLGSNPVGGERFFFSPKLSDYFWGPPKLLLRGYRELFLRGKAVGRDAIRSPSRPMLCVRRSVRTLPCIPSWPGHEKLYFLTLQ